MVLTVAKLGPFSYAKSTPLPNPIKGFPPNAAMTTTTPSTPSQQATSEPLLLQAINTPEKLSRPPVWLMRQAGRYLPEYQHIRSGADFLTMCKRPELAVEVTLQPIRRYGMDASIVFSDILIPLEAMGLSLAFHEKQGPVFHNPLRSPEDLQRLTPFDMQTACWFLLDALKTLRAELPQETALLGFAGAPWTLATYAIEGESVKQGRWVKHWVTNHPEALHQLLTTLSVMLVDYLAAQIEAGAQMVQLFDSWAGLMPQPVYDTFIAPYQRQVIQALKQRHPGTPIFLFVKNSRGLLERMAQTGADGLSIDELTPLSQAFAQTNEWAPALQGNLDPLALATAATPQRVRDLTRQMLDEVATTRHGRGYIANLGHGVLPFTPPENVAAFVETVQGFSY